MCLTKSKYLFILLVLSIIIVFSGCAKKRSSSIRAGNITEDGKLENSKTEKHVRRDIEKALGELEKIYSSSKENQNNHMNKKAISKKRASALKKVNKVVRNTGTLLPVFFDYDKHSIRKADRGTLKNNAEWLRNHPSLKILIAGHADNRGSDEYNLALGDRRAKNVLYYLRDSGVNASIRTVTFGEDKPNCFWPTEGCWSQNRRAEFTVVAAD